ncbi:putative disease resistance protein At1g63350 [Populus alba]|uniref:putative disease resistance protein At1g63350 n=1 Tax=Populus alba TaxID=43335 RepID=UPI003CC74263
MDEKVFKILRFSYMHLKESALQQCFLYCALFPEDFKIPREDLIAYLIDEGVIKGMSRKAEFDKGHSMLNKLQSACLLEKVEFGSHFRCVKMHDLIRDMAIQILQENSQDMVKAGARNAKLQFIADSFFEQLRGLKVLDLSYTGITKLPDSVSELVSLTTLLLYSCYILRHVPSLEKLKALKRLDLSGTWALEKMPQGMECLCNLRRKTIVCGNLSIDRDRDFQVMFPKDIQQLGIDNCDDATSLCIFWSLIKNATELETINISDCNSMESLVSSSWFCSVPPPSPSYSGIFFGLKEFNCYDCKNMKKLFPLVLLPSLVNLECIEVGECEKMEEIICGTRSDEEGVMGEESSTDLKLPKLRSLLLIRLPELKSICSVNLICDSLQSIRVKNCEKKLKRMGICLSLLENGEPSPPPSLIAIPPFFNYG